MIEASNIASEASEAPAGASWQRPVIGRPISVSNFKKDKRIVDYLDNFNHTPEIYWLTTNIFQTFSVGEASK